MSARSTHVADARARRPWPGLSPTPSERNRPRITGSWWSSQSAICRKDTSRTSFAPSDEMCSRVRWTASMQIPPFHSSKWLPMNNGARFVR